jgi:hypothetical protein
MRRLAALWALIGLLAACAAPTEEVAPAAHTISTPPTLDDLPLGPPPRIGYVVDHRFVAPGGLRHPLPRATGVLSVARLGDGFLVQDDRSFEGYTGLAVVRRGTKIEEWSTTAGAVLGLGGSVAWGEATTSEASVQPPPMVRMEVNGVRREQRVDFHPQVAGIIDGEVVFNAMFAPYPTSPGARVTDLVSPPRRLGVRYVADIDELGRRLLAAPRGRRTPMVMGVDELEPLWDPRGRGFQLERFNPSGGSVLARATDAELVVLVSSTGEERGRVVLPDGVSVSQTMWESDKTILLVVEWGREMAVIRATRSGRLEFAVPPMRRTRSWIEPGLVLTERR